MAGRGDGVELSRSLKQRAGSLNIKRLLLFFNNFISFDCAGSFVLHWCFL